jgi:hypothetical protein
MVFILGLLFDLKEETKGKALVVKDFQMSSVNLHKSPLHHITLTKNSSIVDMRKYCKSINTSSSFVRSYHICSI